MILTVVFGLWLLYDYAWQAFSGMLWLHIKLLLVVVLIGYHFYCGHLVKVFANDESRRSHVWFRWFNELPVILLFAIVILVMVKPF
jgi:putative membrane protein